jgi:hypothetical protein
MKQETLTINFNGPLCARIEEFLQQHPEYGNLEEFITAAGRIRREQLAATLPQGPATGPQNRDEEYSNDAVERAWDAANKPPSTAEEKTRLIKDLASCFRNLKAAYLGIADRGDI